jgi:hypothetical protein
MTVLSRARIVFDHSNTGFMGSNPIQNTAYVRHFLRVYVS